MSVSLLLLELRTIIQKHHTLILDMQDEVYFTVTVDVFELGCHWYLIGSIRQQTRTFVDTGVGVINAWKLDDDNLGVKVLENKVSWVISRVAMPNDLISLVHARKLISGVQLLVR